MTAQTLHAGQNARALENFRLFQAFVAALEGEIQLSRDAEKYLYSVNMGATAISTGINVPNAILKSARRPWPGSLVP